MLGTFSNLPSTSRVWVHYSIKELTETDKKELGGLLDDFCKSWTAHNEALVAAWKWEGSHFLFLGVDESQVGASGCSIDKSIRLLREIETQKGISFLERDAVPYKNNEGEISFVKILGMKAAIQAGTIHANTILFNTSVSEMLQLQNEWQQKAGKSWAKRYFPEVNV